MSALHSDDAERTAAFTFPSHSTPSAAERRSCRPDELASGRVTWAVLRVHLLRAAVFILVFNVLAGAWVIFLAGTGSGLIAGVFGLLAGLVVLGWLGSLFVGVQEPIAEEGVLLTGQAAGVFNSFGWIARKIGERRTPFTVSMAKVGGCPALLVGHGREQGMVLVRPLGSDLFIRWSLWRTRSTARLIGHLFRDMLDVVGAGRPYAAELRACTTHALREQIRSVASDGSQPVALGTAITAEDRMRIDALPELILGTPPATRFSR